MEGGDKKFTLINGGKEQDPDTPWKWELKMVDIRLKVLEKINDLLAHKESNPLISDRVVIIIRAAGSRMISKLSVNFATFHRHSFFVEAVRSHLDSRERNSPHAALIMEFWLNDEFRGKKIFDAQIKKSPSAPNKPRPVRVVKDEQKAKPVTDQIKTVKNRVTTILPPKMIDLPVPKIEQEIKEIAHTESAGNADNSNEFADIADHPIDFSPRAWRTYTTNQSIRRIRAALEAVGVTKLRQLFIYIGAAKPTRQQTWEALDRLNAALEKVDIKLKLGAGSHAEFFRWMNNNRYLKSE